VRRQRSPVNSAPELGRVLQERRGELRLSREGVSRLMGVEPAVLSGLETGDGTISLQVALLIVQAVGLDIWVEPIRAHAPQAREYDMFRLRAVEGLTLEEIAVRHGLHRERVRQILRAHFRLGEPWAAKADAKCEPKNGVVASSEPAPRPPPRFRPRPRVRFRPRTRIRMMKRTPWRQEKRRKSHKSDLARKPR
jgi:transcriptional regulator with XRE-family HTH domain